MIEKERTPPKTDEPELMYTWSKYTTLTSTCAVSNCPLGKVPIIDCFKEQSLDGTNATCND